MLFLYCIGVLMGFVMIIAAFNFGIWLAIVGALVIAGSCACIMKQTLGKKGKKKLHFVKSADSETFHKPSCRVAKMIDKKNLKVFTDVPASQLRAMGYKPCTKCKPK